MVYTEHPRTIDDHVSEIRRLIRELNDVVAIATDAGLEVTFSNAPGSGPMMMESYHGRYDPHSERLIAHIEARTDT